MIVYSLEKGASPLETTVNASVGGLIGLLTGLGIYDESRQYPTLPRND